MSIDSDAILDALQSKMLTLGVFERFNMHEPANSPGSGVTGSSWVEDIRPIAARSGLAATSVLFVLNIRCQTNMVTDPQDGIDRGLMKVVDAVLNAFTADFDLGGTVAEVDLLGRYGTALGARPGYLKQGDDIFRVMAIFVPLVLNDVWTQVQ